MTAKDQLKLLKAGFMIIRKDEKNLKIKAKINARREWHYLPDGIFESKAAMQKHVNKLLQISSIVED